MAGGKAKPKQRRLPGEGSISQEADGSWKWKLSNGKTPKGGQKMIVRRAKTWPELQKKIDKVREQLAAGVKIADKSQTVEEWLNEWIEDIRSLNAAPKTMSGYRTDAGHINPIIGHLKLHEIETTDCNRVYSAMTKEGLSPGTVRHTHRTLRACLQTAVDYRKITFNPAKAAELPAEKEFELDPLSRSESLSVLRAARKRRNGARWRVALSLGLRQGEALALQVDDIDFARGTLRVRRQVQRIAWRHGCDDPRQCKHIVKDKHGKKKETRCRGVDCPQRQGPGGLVVRETKGKRSRTLSLPSAMLDELHEQIDALASEALRARNMWEAGPGGGWLFPTEFGALVDPRRDYDSWQALLQDAHVRRIRLHGARHTAATLLLEKGLDERAINETFGWSPSSRQSERYQHWLDEHRSAVAMAMDDVLPGSA